MAAAPRSSAPTMWLSVNGARMIVVALGPGADDATAVTACSRPTAAIRYRYANKSIFDYHLMQISCNSICKFFLSTFLVFQCDLVLAQTTPASSGSYFRDLGRMIGEIRGMQWMVDVCANAYPESKPNNQAAIKNWQQRYQPFVAEMTLRFEEVHKRWERDPSSAKAAPELWEKVNKQINSQLEVMRQNFSTIGEEKARLICFNYPQILTQPRWNLEQYHSDEVATIRRGPN